MKIQEQPDYLIFADEAKTGEVQDFPNVTRGWGVTIDQTQSKPPMEWMNGAFNRIDKNMLYLLQQGIPEWNSAVLYPAGAVIKYKNKIYIAKIENDNSIPSTSTTKWDSLIKDVLDATTAQKGIVKLNSATNSESETDAATPKAVKSSHDLASGAVKKLGDTMTGDLNIKKTEPQLTLVDEQNGNASKITTNKSVFAIQATNPKTSELITRLRYTMDTSVWNFDNVNNVTINGLSVLKLGDYAIGGKSIHLTTSSIDDVIKTQFSWFNTDTTGDKPFTAGWVISSNINDSQAMQLAVAYGNQGISYRTSADGKWGAWVKAVTSENINNYQNGIGVNQKWQDVTALRAVNTVYTNTTGKPIMLSVIPDLWNNGGDCSFYVDNVIVGSAAPSSQYSQKKTVSFIVPSGSVYKMTGSNVAILYWSELR